MTTALVSIGGELPVLSALFAPTPDSARRYVEFFTANTRNPHTRRAYARAAAEFAAWCSGPAGITKLRDIEPVHVASYIETLRDRLAPPSIKQQLAAIRMLFDWLVIGQLLATNPAAPVRGPKYTVKKGKTPVLTAKETRALLNAIDITTAVGLRDRALIGLMIYSFARIGAALAMRVEDVYVEGRRTWVRFHEKGSKEQTMPCHHNLGDYLTTYIRVVGLHLDLKGLLFRSAFGRTGHLTARPLSQRDAHAMIRRRAAAAGIVTQIGDHSFRATGITDAPAQWR